MSDLAAPSSSGSSMPRVRYAFITSDGPDWFVRRMQLTELNS